MSLLLPGQCEMAGIRAQRPTKNELEKINHLTKECYKTLDDNKEIFLNNLKTSRLK